MKINPTSKEHDEIKIPEGAFFEIYTPAVGRITSAAKGGKQLKYAKMILAADATVTFRDAVGNQSTFALKAGPQPFLISEISVCASAVALLHDGVIYSGDPGERGMTDTIFP